MMFLGERIIEEKSGYILVCEDKLRRARTVNLQRVASSPGVKI